MANRFRKVFIICEDNQVFSNITQITIYKNRSDADFACTKCHLKAQEEKQKLWNAAKKLPKFKVHGFYLVHEDMFRD